MPSPSNADANDSQGDGQYAKYRKRRAYNQRACDKCRRKKSDGIQQGSSQCSNCAASKSQCTYDEPHKASSSLRGLSLEYVEKRLERAVTLLKKFYPEADILKALEDDESLAQLHFVGEPSSLTTSLTSPTRPPPPRNVLSSRRSTNERMTIELEGGQQGDSSDEDSPFQVSEYLKKLHVGDNVVRFWGKSSGVMLVKSAVNLKSIMSETHVTHWASSILAMRRPQFWHQFPWEDVPDPAYQSRKYTFPPDDLMISLVEHYFREINIFCPLLHRPTFIGQIMAQRHHTDVDFAPIVLLVCAVGARFSDDPRVLIDGTSSWQSAGWQWFRQVQYLKPSLFRPPALHDLQYCVLSTHFLQATSAPQACWNLVGAGVRAAQDAGAHRHRELGSMTKAESELWKRAFWILVYVDRMCAQSLGRPCATEPEDYDLELPVECDDEYWDHPDPSQAWKQPPGKPSLLSSFISKLHLSAIIPKCLRTIYPVNKTLNSEEQQDVVAELDSSLNAWASSIPDHLRWNPEMEDELFLRQSVDLYTVYYALQILVHKPFIPTPRKPSPLEFPSLAICTNAARSCIHVNDVYMRRMGHPLHVSFVPLIQCGVILILNVWSSRMTRQTIEHSKEALYIQKVMTYLKALEDRWHLPGRLWDVLYGLTVIGNMPGVAKPADGVQSKRGPDTDATADSHRRSASYTSEYMGTFAASDSPAVQHQTFANFPLPMHGWYPQDGVGGHAPEAGEVMRMRDASNATIYGASEAFEYGHSSPGEDLGQQRSEGPAVQGAPALPNDPLTQWPADMGTGVGLSPPPVDASATQSWGMGPQGFA
ncbi:fungal-specific transcription factor domain-containing protein [Schizophyllum fasciatum]